MVVAVGGLFVFTGAPFSVRDTFCVGADPPTGMLKFTGFGVATIFELPLPMVPPPKGRPSGAEEDRDRGVVIIDLLADP